jgi:hypothetical protein
LIFICPPGATAALPPLNPARLADAITHRRA